MPTITMIPVQSSQIAAIGFDEPTLTLAITFVKGGVYHYLGVSRNQFEALRDASSIGSAFYRMIKGRYEYQRIEMPTAVAAEQVAAAIELVHSALINLDNLGRLSNTLSQHPMFTITRVQLVDGLAKLGREVAA